jgi:cation/acetate symporter
MNTAGVIAGLLVGTILSIGLVMVSPNMTYPQTAAKTSVSLLEKKIATGAALNEKETAEMSAAKAVISSGATSMLGLTDPLFPLKNPGIVSIPVGFLAAILAALAFPNRRSEEMFDEVYVRQNTGLGMAKAVDH